MYGIHLIKRYFGTCKCAEQNHIFPIALVIVDSENKIVSFGVTIVGGRDSRHGT